MYGIQGDARYIRQRREDIRQEISQNYRNQARRRAGSGVVRIFVGELVLDARRLVAYVLPARRKRQKKGVS